MLSLAATEAPQRAPGEPHPIVGSWRWTRAINACTETYEFRSDGTLFVISGAERSDNTYTVSRSADAHGFFELRMKVIKDHGGMDCGNTEFDDTGKEHLSYILFEPGLSMYISCSEPRLQACFGPLRRVPD